MNRIKKTLDTLKKKNEKALVCFVTAGFPKLHSTVSLVQAIEQGGADIVELGMPFSDPLAEGPVIQHSSQAALKNGCNLEVILSQVENIRKHSNIPIVLMGYLNPIFRYGSKKFFPSAAQAGVDGLILPELPLEESGRFRTSFRAAGLANIILVSPTTPLRRVTEIDAKSEGFLYCVSTTGVTGSKDLSHVNRYISSVKHAAKKNPVLVGFGIQTPNDARKISRVSDGVIVGSQLIRQIQQSKSTRDIVSFVKRMKQAMA